MRPAIILFFATACGPTGTLGTRAAFNDKPIAVKNQCSDTIWIATEANDGNPALRDKLVRLDPNGSHTYEIPVAGWSGRFWPKAGCDSKGTNCDSGEALPPCPAIGCEPPADTKVEVYFPGINSADRPYYDISLVDGYSLPVKVTPRGGSGKRCTETTCDLSLDLCPVDEASVGDLQVKKGGSVVQCMSPCDKWNYPAPYGEGKKKSLPPGLMLCCPNPPISPTQCQAGAAATTKYTSLVHSSCPTAYAYSFDDKAGSHDCTQGTTFDVVFCP